MPYSPSMEIENLYSHAITEAHSIVLTVRNRT